MKPKRIQRKRSKGFRLPENTICINRPTKWGNPFVVGVDGTQFECVEMFKALCKGYVCISSHATIEKQKSSMSFIAANIGTLKGKNLACFCRVGSPCHGEILLILANQ